MNFDQYWNNQPKLNAEKINNPAEVARIAAGRAFHFAQRQERERCLAAVESIPGDTEPAPDHAYEFMIENRQNFDAGINAAILLTKQSAIEAIKNTKG